MKMKILIALMLIIASGLQSAAKVTEIDDIWDIKYNNRPMVIEAYASWCQPCRIYRPIVERLSREYEGTVDFYKVNVDNPDAVDFIDRYEVNSVPLTVFLWDPSGDATVKHSVEQGLMNYDELKYHIEETISKQYKQNTYSSTSAFGWSSGLSADAAMAYTDFIPDMQNFLGEWQGSYNGNESKLWFFKQGGELQGVGGALDSQMFSLINSVYWVARKFDWDHKRNALLLTDILPETPMSPFAHIDDGIFRERYLQVHNRRIIMEVEEFKVADGLVYREPFNTYTVEYHRCS